MVNAKLVLGFGLYWAICFLFYVFAHPYIAGFTFHSGNSIVLISNDATMLGPINIEPGGFLGSLWSFIKLAFQGLLFAFFGMGLPISTPLWAQMVISTWQFIVFMMGVVLILGVIPGEG